LEWKKTKRKIGLGMKHFKIPILNFPFVTPMDKLPSWNFIFPI